MQTWTKSQKNDIIKGMYVCPGSAGTDEKRGGDPLAKKKSNVIKYHSARDVKITFIFLLFIVIYGIFRSFQLFTQEHITIYEVTEQRMAEDNMIKGIIIRDEEVFTTKDAGYINYYIGEGEKVGKNTTVYSLDENGTVYSLLTQGNVSAELSTDDSVPIRNKILSFKNAYSPDNYSQMYEFQYSMENTILQLTNTSRVSKMKKVLKDTDNTDSFSFVKAEKSGVISFSIDGMESRSVSDLTAEDFTDMTETKEQLRSDEEAKAGSAVYKLVKSEDWHIAIALNDSQYENLKDANTISVKFKNEGIRATARVSLFDLGKKHYADLKFDRYMVRFINQRYVEIELEFGSTSGLKLPVSAVFKQTCYKIPIEYMTNGGDGQEDSMGFVVRSYDEKGKESFQFVDADIYRTGSKYAFVSKKSLKKGDLLVLPEDYSNTYQVGKTGRIKGVYNVNKGYCQFKYVRILYENNEYCIVDKETPGSLSTYDHIVINPECINESDIIH